MDRSKLPLFRRRRAKSPGVKGDKGGGKDVSIVAVPPESGMLSLAEPGGPAPQLPPDRCDSRNTEADPCRTLSQAARDHSTPSPHRPVENKAKYTDVKASEDISMTNNSGFRGSPKKKDTLSDQSRIVSPILPSPEPLYSELTTSYCNAIQGDLNQSELTDIRLLTKGVKRKGKPLRTPGSSREFVTLLDSPTSPHHDYVELDYSGIYEECLPVTEDYTELNIYSNAGSPDDAPVTAAKRLSLVSSRDPTGQTGEGHYACLGTFRQSPQDEFSAQMDYTDTLKAKATNQSSLTGENLSINQAYIEEESSGISHDIADLESGMRRDPPGPTRYSAESAGNLDSAGSTVTRVTSPNMAGRLSHNTVNKQAISTPLVASTQGQGEAFPVSALSRAQRKSGDSSTKTKPVSAGVGRLKMSKTWEDMRPAPQTRSLQSPRMDKIGLGPLSPPPRINEPSSPKLGVSYFLCSGDNLLCGLNLCELKESHRMNE